MELENEIKKHKSCRRDDITHYKSFTLQPKSDTEIGWGPQLWEFEK